MYNSKQMAFLENRTKYIWWQEGAETLQSPERLVAQIMNMGTVNDVAKLENLFSKNELLEILKTAHPGHFNERSWFFWHYRLGYNSYDDVPALPKRSFTE